MRGVDLAGEEGGEMSASAVRTVKKPAFTTQSREPGWWGMVLFILTEGMLFSLLITSYYYLYSGSSQWPQGGIAKPELFLPSVATVILLASSGPLVFATRSLAKGSTRGALIGLVWGFVLGAVFLGIQAYEFIELDFSASTNAYGSLFWTLSGFHAFHLVLGLMMVAFTAYRVTRGHFDAEHRLGVETTAMYWHFVDAVWVVVFLTLHISPYVLSSSPA
jgi:heme/copper-type cytochrome/quinol oxidase subunit 3